MARRCGAFAVPRGCANRPSTSGGGSWGLEAAELLLRTTHRQRGWCYRFRGRLRGCRLGQRPRPSFLPVRMVEPRVAESVCGVEIVLAHGHTVRVQAGVDRQTLADVLEVRPC